MKTCISYMPGSYPPRRLIVKIRLPLLPPFPKLRGPVQKLPFSVDGKSPGDPVGRTLVGDEQVDAVIAWWELRARIHGLTTGVPVNGQGDDNRF